MIPILFEIGPFKVGSFGVMMVAAFLTCVFMMKKELRRLGHNQEWAVNIVLMGAVGGIVGARLYFILEHLDQFMVDPAAMIFSGSGLTWYGGFIGGTIAVILTIHFLPVAMLPILDIAAPLVLLGHAIGRIGCLLAGDGDYGPPTDVPWAMSFPDGLVPTTQLVHPTPIYDSLMSAAAFLMIWPLRGRARFSGLMVGLSVGAYGVVRFISEFFRTTPKILFGWMTAAQGLSVAAILFAIIWIASRSRLSQTSPGSHSPDPK